ncbi:MAG: threonylcarbamoyl-AMP synthase [Deltaproteobacteria bacterium RIFOXYD12_FULL_57_12]|nr:MAG: threonylcarbamoyl-AMP synthase [Deltaproteobacteria bacterium RIFOXYD12_FULL_57_12]
MSAAGEHDLSRAVQVLQQGGVVAFPTETYYGLAVDPFNSTALARLFRLKQRASHKPILVLIHSREQLSGLAREVPPVFLPLMARYWPGPLTLVFGALQNLPQELTAGTGTVGVRISSHPLAGRLVAAFGRPITATSANISGLPAANSAADVQRQFGAGIDLVLDGGLTPGGHGSTVVGLQNDRLFLIRAGGIPYEQVEETSRT